MKRLCLLLCLAVLSASLVATRAHAQSCSIGGHDETSENFAPGGWGIVGASPGAGPAGLPVAHLVISEVAPRGFGIGALSDSSEYVEIYNPTSRPVDLDDKYVSDDIGYYRIVNGTYPAANSSDWAGRFPPGLRLDPGRTLIICVSKTGFAASGASPGGAQYFLEMRNTNANTADDMTILTTGSVFPLSGGMMTNPGPNGGEWIVLYCWNGTSDLVCDIDYASWGANVVSNPKMNKTGLSIDGPDAGAATSAFNTDTAPGTQTNLGASTVLAKPNTYQRIGGGEAAESTVNGNGCVGRVQPTVIDWLPVAGTNNIRFHIRWENPDDDASSSPVNGQMSSQEFGVFLSDYGHIGNFNVPPLQPASFFDVFFEVPLSSLPPAPEKILPGGGPGAPAGGLAPLGTGAAAVDCPPDTNWAGNVDIVWLGPGQGGQVGVHYADLLTCIGGPPSYIHFRGSNCPNPMPWTIAGLCPGFTSTLVNEDFTPAPNPVPVGWTGWICVSAAVGLPTGASCCFGVTFTCNGASSTINICSTACDWSQHPPTLSTVDWTTVGTSVEFHQQWVNTSSTATSDPVSGDMSSQQFGVFLPNFGPIGHFDVPPMAPNSFFDVFFTVPLSQLPPQPAKELPGGGPQPGGPCPPPTIEPWNGNVDIHWNGPGGTGQVNKHVGDLLICPGAPPSYVHVLTFCNSPVGASWSITGLCPGFGATLVNEDKTPAPNPVPGGWTGFICVAAGTTVAIPDTCCFKVNFVCDGVPGVIDLCAITCNWEVVHPTLAEIDWVNIGTAVRFHLGWRNDNPTSPSQPVSGDMTSQAFGVFQPNFGPIGHFDVPPMQPNSFFDVFFEVPLSELPPEPPKELPGGGPPPGSTCPPSQEWNGNVDVIWSGQGGSGTTQKHQGDLNINLGSTPSYIHVGFTNCPNPAPWTITGLCAGFSATLVNEDKSPAPNPIPPGWSGWICVSASSSVPSNTTCCIDVNFQCDGGLGVIDLCATSCSWTVSNVTPVPGNMTFGIFRTAPNPTLAGMVIDFVLPRDGQVKVEVFDLSGRHVKSLLNGPAVAGVNSVRWDGRGENGSPLSPGAYFVKLSVAGRISSRKVVLYH
jgi:hypothetical protein